MPDRSGHLIAQSRTPVATAGTALLIWLITAGAAWPQAGSAPSAAPVQPPGSASYAGSAAAPGRVGIATSFAAA